MNNVFHAYIFLGNDENTAKQALQLAKKVNCQSSSVKPCENCRACRKIQNKSHPDVVHIYPDGASIKIDQVRKLILRLAEKPVEGAKRIYILHGADTMTVQSQNALLKTLEEPLTESIIILLTTNLRLLIPTVISRCQLKDFSNTSSEPVLLMEQRQKIANILLAQAGKNKSQMLNSFAAEISEIGENSEQILEFILSLYRDVLLVKTNSKAVLINEDLKHLIRQYSKLIDLSSAVLAIDIVSEQLKAAKSKGNKSLIWYNLLMGLEEVV